MNDQQMFDLINKETIRQQDNIELIASENYVSEDILRANGSILTNKYAEGYVGKRYYGGCEHIDEIEELTIERAKKLFNCKFANVQPHSGSSANMTAFRVLLNSGDKVLGMKLDHGGHLTHGHPANFSGIDYSFISYGVNPDTEMIDYENIRQIVLKEKPRLILAGASAYSRTIDFKIMKEIADEVGAYLMVDIAHIAGLVATGLHPSPLPYADIVTSTTHKTLRGARGGIILTNNKTIAKEVDKTIFPGIQGGPLVHIIAAKGISFYEALQPEFKKYMKQVLTNARVLAETLAKQGFRIISGGTDNHLILVDVKGSVGMTGKEAESILDKIKITTNKNTIPFDKASPMITSGLRLGTAAMTTRGLKECEFVEIGIIIAKALKNSNDAETLDKLQEQVLSITNKFPLTSPD